MIMSRRGDPAFNAESEWKTKGIWMDICIRQETLKTINLKNPTAPPAVLNVHCLKESLLHALTGMKDNTKQKTVS